MDELQTAIQSKNLVKVQELLENPAIVSTLNTKRVEDGKSYLYFAIYNNVDEDILFALINKGADINFIYTDEDGLQIPVFRYLLSNQALRMEYDNILVEFIRRGVRDIPWYDESIGILIIHNGVPNPENYRYPAMISPDLITSESVTVTYMEYNGETDSYTESQPIHISKENAFSALNKDYGRKHGNLYTIKWENNIIQTYHLYSSPDVPVLIHFKYFEHSRLDYTKQYVVHKKIVNPSDPRNPSSYYPSPDIEICNIYSVNYFPNSKLLFGTHIKFFNAPTIHTIVGATSDNYACIPDRDTPRNEQDKTWSIINDRPILEMPEFSTDVFSSDMITVDNDPPVNMETAKSLLNLSKKVTWTSGDGKKFKLIIASYGQISKHYLNFFNYKTDDIHDLFAILEWDQNGTDVEHNPLYLYKDIKNTMHMHDGYEDDDPIFSVEDEDEYYKSEEFKARILIESKIRILNVYHVGKNLKQLKEDVTTWLEYYFPQIPNYRLNNRWERAGHVPVFPTHEGINEYTTGENRYSREEIMMILNYYGILVLPVSKDRIEAWLLKLPGFPTYPLNNKWETPAAPGLPSRAPVFPTNEEITEFLNSQPAAGAGSGVSKITRDDIIMILKYYGIYIQPPLPTNFEEGAVSECSICMSHKNYNINSMNNPYRIIVLKCGHTFHKHCMERQHAQKLAQHLAPFQCPNCRDTYYVRSHTPYVFKGIQLGGSYYEKFQKYKAKINLN
jgi:hypothetical protein